MPDGFDVAPDDLDTHRNHVSRSVDQVQEALSAARQVSMPTEAYGKICQFLPPMLDPAEQKGIDALEASLDGLTELARSLQDAGGDYRTVDEAGRDTFSRKVN